MTKTKLIIFGTLLFLLHPLVSSAGWEYISPMPHGRYGHDSVVGPDGRIFVMGGMVFEIKDKKMGRKYNNGEYSNLVYAPNKDFWSYLDPVPGAVTAHFDKDKDGKIRGPNRLNYGNPNDGWLLVEKANGEEDLYEIVSPESRRGEKITLNPEDLRNTNFRRQGDGTQIVAGQDGLIYWLGGREVWIGKGDNIVLPYNPKTNKWPRVWTESYHPPRYIPDDYPEELKKELSKKPSNVVEYKIYYNTDMPPMQEVRLRHEAVVTPDGNICVLGGHNYSGKNKTKVVLDSMECYDPEKNTWEFRKPMLSRKMIFAAVATPDDKIFVFGGSEDYFSSEIGEPYLDAVEVYDIKTDTWSKRPRMPEPRGGHAAVLASDGKIYVIGGSNAIRSSPIKKVSIYNPGNNSWSKGPDMNVPRSLVSAVATPDGRIYAIGGTDAGAYPQKEKFNFFLPRKKELYTGRVQETVEVLDINKLQ